MADMTPTETAAGLRASLRDLIEESRALRQDVRTDAQKRQEEMAQRRRESLITLGVAVLFGIVILIVLAVAWQNNQIGQQNRRISHQIADCTTAGGDCYRQGQERTADAIGELVKANLYIEECARQAANDTDAELEACVAAKLASD